MSFYGLENEPVKSFLSYIKIHTFAKRQWAGYKLINPLIVSWTHDNMNYSAGEPAQHTMSIAYEAVVYDSGSVSAGNPPGFGTSHYDSSPSPLTIGGPNNFSPVVGTGVRVGADQIFDNKIAVQTQTPENTFSFTGKSLTAIDNYNNTKNLPNATSSNPTVSVPLTSTAQSGRGALNNISFPINDNVNKPTLGVLRNLTNTA
jgi:hypothetical protein